MELTLLGVLLIIVGLILIVLAFLGIPRAGSSSGSVAGIILIGPIPIVFGKNVKVTWLIVLAGMALLMTVSMLILVGALHGG